MSHLLDTNVVSELRKPESRIDPVVAAWSAEQEADALYLSAVTVFELETGVRHMEVRDPRQGAVLRRWFEDDVLAEFEQRILSVDVPVARHASGLNVPHRRQMPDVLIAATAAVHRLIVVTRNVRDFEPLGVETINPWSAVQP